MLINEERIKGRIEKKYLLEVKTLKEGPKKASPTNLLRSHPSSTYAKFSEKHFLPPDTHTCIWSQQQSCSEID